MANVPVVPSSWDEKAFKSAYDQLKDDVDAETPKNKAAVEVAGKLLTQLADGGELDKKIRDLDARLKKIGSGKVDKGGEKVGSLKDEMDALVSALKLKMNKLTPYKRAGKTDTSPGNPWKDLNDLLKKADDLRQKAKDDKAKARRASGSGVGVETKMKMFGASVTGMTAGVSGVSVSLVGTRIGFIGAKAGGDACQEVLCGGMVSAARGFETELITARKKVEAIEERAMAAGFFACADIQRRDALLTSLARVQAGGVG